MPQELGLATASLQTVLRESDNKLMIMTTTGLRTAEELGITFSGIGGGGGGGGTSGLDPNVGSHVLEYTAGGKPYKDTWTYTDGTVRVKTYTYVNGRYAGESDWVVQP